MAVIFTHTRADGTEAEFVLVAAAEVGEVEHDEWRALLDGKTSLDQWLHDVGAAPGDSLLLVRRIAA